MSGILSPNAKESPNLMPIQVIASFSLEGKMKPLYLSINGVILKVVNTVEHLEYGVSSFNCSVIDNDRIKSIQVHYHKNETLWTTPKR